MCARELSSSTASRYSDMLCRIGQQSDVPGALDGLGQHALMLGAGAGLAARQDASALRQVLPEQVHILIVDAIYAIDAELAETPSKSATTSSAAAKSAARSPLFTILTLLTTISVARRASARAALGASFSFVSIRQCISLLDFRLPYRLPHRRRPLGPPRCRRIFRPE
jgi:hypothetical protein